MHSVALLMVGSLLVGLVFLRWHQEQRRHTRKLHAIAARIHVNGIRGKSTVTRLIAGALRESGIATVGKTTGSAAVVIDTQGRDKPIKRRGAPTLLEQIDVLRDSVPTDTRAIVFECMAVRPDYQRASENLLMHSTVGVLTNVREDHMEELGATLPEIARSLANSCPKNGLFVTGEQDPALIEVLEQEVAARGSRLRVAEPETVSDAELQGFGPFAFADNVALALAVAEELGIERDTALRGMHKAPDDPGAAVLRTVRAYDREVTWVNLLAVNDRQSTAAAFDKAVRWCGPDIARIALLNNRVDREDRALQFADIAAADLNVDRIAVLGAYEGPVIDRLLRNGVERSRILALGAHRRLSTDAMLRTLVESTDAQRVMLAGFVNIHTEQAEALIAHFETEPADDADTAATVAAGDIDTKAVHA